MGKIKNETKTRNEKKIILKFMEYNKISMRLDKLIIWQNIEK